MADAVRVGRAQDVPTPNRYSMIGSVLTDLRKFAVDSAVNISIKGVTGGKKVYKIMQERLIDRPSPCLNEKKKPEDCRAVEKMQVKIEEIEEEMDNIKQQSTPSAKTVGVSEPLKKTPSGGNKGLDFDNDNRKRIFIRSRL
ncbi:hypothetical protein SLA2020_396540 [Shorea laevis]